jgi:hypothetical protein
MNPKPGAKPKQSSGGGGGDGGSDEGGEDGDDEEGGEGGSKESDLYNSYTGSSLTTAEMNKLVKLKCTDVVKNNHEFGPTYASNAPNFEFIIASCPPGCHK